LDSTPSKEKKAMTRRYLELNTYLNGAKFAGGVMKSGRTATWEDINGWDGVHLLVSVLLLAGAWSSRFPSFSSLGRYAVVGIDGYFLVLLLLAACRCHQLLPDRFTALFIALFTFAALVFAFATVFLENGRFEKRELGMDSRTKRVTVSSPTLTDAREARYVSLAVITTAAPDYAPTTSEGRREVALETLSGLLFLLVAFPILAARLAVFEGPPKAPDGKFRVKFSDGKWQVTVVRDVTTEVPGVLGEEAEVVITNGKVFSVTKVK